MTTIPIWKRPHAFVWHWPNASPEMLAALWPQYKVVHVHLVDDGPVPADWVRRVKAIGFKVFGVIGDYRPEGGPWYMPEDAARFLLGEDSRFAREGAGRLNGFDCNFEDVWEGQDKASGYGGWSVRFLDIVRFYRPRKNLCLNTYDECGEILLAEWARRNARLYLQTYKGGVEPPAMIEVKALEEFALRYGWPAKKMGAVKPCLAVFANSSGVRVPVPDQVASMKQADTVGFAAYYVDGADLGEPEKYLRPLADAALWAGVAL